MRRTSATVALASLLALGTACADGDGGDDAATTVAPATTAAPTTAADGDARREGEPLGSFTVRATRAASLDRPVAFAVHPRTGQVHVVEQHAGRVVALRDGRVERTVVDLGREVSTGNEQGLLGLAFSPDGARLYTHHTTDDDIRITEWDAGGGARRELLRVDDFAPNHNGGQLVVRPDGTLWIALGDGGGGGDPEGNGQDRRSLLGKILRIDPRPSGDRPYAVPADNPFVGDDGARPEVWAYGLRNPWRFSFDRETGDLWIADVGQGSWEEVDLEPAGSRGGVNYGWNRREGAHRFQGGARPVGAVDPLFEYPTGADGSCAVIGGFVYRGRAIPALRGAYVFGDACNGRIRAVRVRDGRVAERGDLGLTLPGLSSFGEDGDGELWVLELGGAVSRVVAG